MIANTLIPYFPKEYTPDLQVSTYHGLVFLCFVFSPVLLLLVCSDAMPASLPAVP
jgi:hypothetical protein